MSDFERNRYIASIPGNPEFTEAAPPEGLAHDRAARRSRESLEHFFRKRGRQVFIASNLRVIYPGEPAFAPDLLAVLDVAKSEDDELPAWVVVQEKRGLDFVLEIHVSGDRRKDGVTNVERYARLGIPEYFLYDRPGRRLLGWRLPKGGARTYQPLLPQLGRLASQVLDLDLGLLDGRLRFFMGTTELPDAAELVGRLDTLVSHIETRLEDAQRQLAMLEVAREEEQRRREDAERRVCELQAELDRLKKPTR